MIVEVEVPDGYKCKDGKKCPFVLYNKKNECFYCNLFERMLKGGSKPDKCYDCISYKWNKVEEDDNKMM